MDTLLAILERFVGRKFLSFLVTAIVAHWSLQSMDMERANTFLTFIERVLPFYFASEGAADVVKAWRGQVPPLTKLVEKKVVEEK